MQRKPIIFAIVGPSGSGKTTAAAFASKALGIPVICSYTTRPMRPGEQQGRDHIFVSDIDTPQSKDELLAYTEFGGYKYWATKSQASTDCIYIVDERGYRDLAKNDNYEVVSILISCDKSFCDESRSTRDSARTPLADNEIDAFIMNDDTLESFESTLTWIMTEIVNAYQFYQYSPQYKFLVKTRCGSVSCSLYHKDAFLRKPTADHTWNPQS